MAKENDKKMEVLIKNPSKIKEMTKKLEEATNSLYSVQLINNFHKDSNNLNSCSFLGFENISLFLNKNKAYEYLQNRYDGLSIISKYSNSITIYDEIITPLNIKISDKKDKEILDNLLAFNLKEEKKRIPSFSKRILAHYNIYLKDYCKITNINTEFVEEIDKNINFNNKFKIFYVTKYNPSSKDVENDLKEILRNNGHTLYILPESEKNNSSTMVFNSIYREMAKADYVIVNISNFFAKDIKNVWIELGLALGMKKDKVLIINNSEEVKEKDIPSDIKGLWRLEYNSINDLRKKIMNELQKNILITSEK